MSRLPDLVADTLLYTQFSDVITSHSFPEIDEIGRRSFRTEQWKYERPLGKKGLVRLERCVSEGPNRGSVRVVQKINTQARPRRVLDFTRELEAFAKFSNDRYKRWFVKSFGWFENMDSILLTMEYCIHGDLQYYLSTRRSLPVTETQELGFQILEALHQMHENDFAHTNLRPGNILIKSMPPNETWWVVLSDFGINKHAYTIGETSATDSFIAPELLQLANQPAPHHIKDFKAADMWALGETFIQMLTGQATFRNQHELMEYCSGKPFPFDRLSLSISASGMDFISRLMAVYPHNRLRTSQCIEHSWMSSQRTTLADELAGLHIGQYLPFGWSQSDMIPSTTRTNFTNSQSIPAVPKVQRKPVAFNSHQTTSPGSEEKRLWQDPPAVTEEKQVYYSPRAEVDEKQVWQNSSPVSGQQQLYSNQQAQVEEKQVWQDYSPLVPEQKQVYLNPQTQMEEKQVLQNSSVIPEDKELWQDYSPTVSEHNETYSSLHAEVEEKQALRHSLSLKTKQIVHESAFTPKTALQTLNDHVLPVNAVAYSRDGSTLVSASDDGTVRLWDSHLGTSYQTLHGHGHAVKAVSISPDGMTLVSAMLGTEDSIRLWDISSGAQLQAIQFATKAVNALALSPDGKTLASASMLDTGAVKLWDCQSGASLKKLSGHWLNINALRFSPHGKTLASASNDGYIKLWDVESGRTLKTLWGYSQWVNAVALEPTGNRAKVLAPGGVRDIAYSPYEEIIASASDDGAVRIWDTRSGKAIKTFKRQWRLSTISPVGVNAVNFSPDGKTLVSASDDGTIKLWDIRTAAVFQTLKAHTKWISAVTFSPDGKTLASSSHDSTIKLWG